MKPDYRMEADARVVIDDELRERGWDKAQIFRESAPPEYKSALQGKKPDYVLCHKNSHKPLAIIEAKAPNKDLKKALEQGLDYAQKLGCSIVFASDGMLTITAHSRHEGKPLLMNKEEVRSFLSENALLNFQDERIWSQGEVIRNSQDLIKVFSAANKKLTRDEGMVSIDAFAEFSQILFFKLFSELADAEDKRVRDLPAHWRDIKTKIGDDLLDSYKNALRKLSVRYQGVFMQDTEIRKPMTLENIVKSLEKYSLASIKADIKGEAYEYFLRQYNKQKSELAQYFTPRHVVHAMVALCNPRLGEKIYDPFCGTGGMLIEAFRHLNRNTENLSDQQVRVLQADTIFGNEISRSVCAAKMNMILAGDGHNGIRHGDSLENPVNGDYDVVITNIPFARQDEKEYIKHCLNAVRGRPNGRVCMIVPERFLDADEYTSLREEVLQEWTVKRVISLPRELFSITVAKTSIIYVLWGDGYGNVKPVVENRRDFIPYFEVRNDGYTLDKKRDPKLGQNDLDIVIETRHDTIKEPQHYAERRNNFAFKPADKEEFDFNYPVKPLSDLVTVADREIKITSDMICREPGMKKEHEIFLKEARDGFNVKVSKRKRILPGDLVFALLHTQNGLFAYSDAEYHGTTTHLVCRVDEDKIDKDFLFWVLDFVIPQLSMVDTTGRENYKEKDILELMIPLPPLAEQRHLVGKVKALRENMIKLESELATEKKVFSRELLSSARD